VRKWLPPTQETRGQISFGRSPSSEPLKNRFTAKTGNLLSPGQRGGVKGHTLNTMSADHPHKKVLPPGNLETPGFPHNFLPPGPQKEELKPPSGWKNPKFPSPKRGLLFGPKESLVKMTPPTMMKNIFPPIKPPILSGAFFPPKRKYSRHIHILGSSHTRAPSL